MDINYVIALTTVLITLIVGEITKKFTKIPSKYVIPIQNLLIGIIVASIQWIITGDFSGAIASSGLVAGGTYDLVKNISLFISNNEEVENGDN